MKANHNDKMKRLTGKTVVVNISKSKNESKSQLNVRRAIQAPGCGQYQ